MSWTKLAPPRATRIHAVMLRITTAGFDSPHLIIRVDRDIARAAGLPHETSGRVDLFLGEGADAGRMRLESSPSGTYAAFPQGKSAAVRICLKTHPGWPAEWAATVVDADAADGGLVFPLPWHKRAADRTVEAEEEPDELPPLPLRPVTLEDITAPLSHGREKAAEKGNGVSAVMDRRASSHPPAPSVARPRADPAAVAAYFVGDQIEELADKPVNGTAKGHVYADSEEIGARHEFSHNGRSCLLNKRQHIVATKLHAAMTKVPGGFIPYDVLIKAAGITDKPVLAAEVSRTRKLIRPLGLDIEAQPGMGFFMREAE